MSNEQTNNVQPDIKNLISPTSVNVTMNVNINLDLNLCLRPTKPPKFQQKKHNFTEPGTVSAFQRRSKSLGTTSRVPGDDVQVLL